MTIVSSTLKLVYTGVFSRQSQVVLRDQGV